MSDFVRALVTTAMICALWWQTGLTTTVLPGKGLTAAATADISQVDTRMAELELIGTIIKDGGAAAVILVILFFYRRDYRTLTEFWKQQHAITVQLAKDAATAQTTTAAALQENTIVTHALKRVIEFYFPDRRKEAELGGRIP